MTHPARNTRARATKPKKCKHCAELFVPQRSLQKACGYECALAVSRAEQTEALKRKNAEDLKARKEAIKPRSKWVQEVQVEFNKFIRTRDTGKGCISCGRSTGAKMNAGHYRPVGGFPELRFNELNCHIQCESCNNYKSGNLSDYRVMLVGKIGLSLVEWLEGPHKPLKLTTEELKVLKAHYKQQTKLLLKDTP